MSAGRPAAAPGRRRALAAIASACWGAEPAARAAPGFVQRPVRLVVPYSAGVGPDVVARSLADRLAQRWGQPVWVENKPGASGIVAFAEVRRVPPDGHTLFVADTATLAVNPLVHATLPYDPARDLVPLTLLFQATFLLWVGGDSRLRSLAGLLEAARRAPGSVSYASLGNGHASQVAIETFARAAGVRLLHIPFRDAPAMLTAVAGGDVDFTAVSMHTVAGLAAQGRLRPLAVADGRRLSAHPEIPTIAEAGGPAVQMHPWAALVTVAGTPVAVLEQLIGDLAAVLAQPELRERAGQAGFEITPSTPQMLRERILADAAQVGPLVSEGRIVRD